MAVAVAGDVAPEQLHELGALGARADQAHLTAQHVEQLGQLVEGAAAQDAAYERAPILAVLDAARRGVERAACPPRRDAPTSAGWTAAGTTSKRIERNL